MDENEFFLITQGAMKMKTIDLNAEQMEILTKAKAEIERRNITQGAASREMDISPSALTQLFKGTYNADPSNQIEKIEKWLTAAEALTTSLPKTSLWVPTPTSERVKAALAYSHMMKSISLVYGGAGLGKTVTAKEYARSMPNVWIATMNPTTKGTVSALEQIYLALGLELGWTGGAARIHREICRRIIGTGGLLIIDEAQHLETEAIDSIRSLFDATEVGITFMGNETVFTRMTGGTKAAAFDRLFSRISKKVRLISAEPSDITMLAEQYGVTDNKSLKMLQKLGGQAGALRSVDYVLKLATMIDGTTPDFAKIQSACRELN